MIRAAVVLAFLVPCVARAQLVRIESIAPAVRVSLGYAAPSNFTHRTIYPKDARCYVRAEVAESLARVQAALEKQALGLLLWDCYRPPEAQQKLWDARPDPRYVADPKKGSRHARGAAVDVTLVDAEGHELSMPTTWDDASPRAHRSFADLPADVLAHRAILDAAMKAEGFVGLPTEWWHFDAGDARAAPALDLAFEELTLKEAPQYVVVIADGWDAKRGTLRMIEHGREVAAFPVDLGRGLGWGRGVHASSLSRLGGFVKREGDGRSPAGVFALTELTGYDAEPPRGTTLPYRQADANLYCVDDPSAPEYNRFAIKTPSTRWHSTEPMRRNDELYRRTVFVAHNPDGRSGAGSCIFLHVTRGTPTIGCTAMSLDRLEKLIAWLKPGALLVQLPRSVYEQLGAAWDLTTPSRGDR